MNSVSVLFDQVSHIEMTWKYNERFQKRQSWPIKRRYTGICLGRLKKITTHRVVGTWPKTLQDDSLQRYRFSAGCVEVTKRWSYTATSSSRLQTQCVTSTRDVTCIISGTFLYFHIWILIFLGIFNYYFSVIKDFGPNLSK